MDAVLHRIEALPGESRYAVTFRRSDAGEQTAVWQLGGGVTEVAEAGLPPGWSRDSPQFVLTRAAVEAVHAARAVAPRAVGLSDVAGGWDVGLGNVVLAAGDTPTCTAHGALADRGDTWVCAECGARAVLMRTHQPARTSAT